MTSICFQRSYQRSFGTYPLKGDELTSAVRAATQVGYRAFDTAQMYDNEADVGAALADLGLPRDELCVTTKVDIRDLSHDLFLPSVEASLKALRLDVVDVLLLHWPLADGAISEPLVLLCEAKRKGLTRHIGVSNFTAAMMREAARRVDDSLAANQVEFHPPLDQSILVDAAIETGVPLSSYCSVARGALFEHSCWARSPKSSGRPPSRSCFVGSCRKASRSTRCRRNPKTSLRTSTSWTSRCRTSTWRASTH